MSSLDGNAPLDLILGCGYLGQRVAVRWRAAGRRVAALTRRNAASLAACGIEPIVGDVLEPASLTNLPRASTILYAIGLDRTAGKTMREVYVHGLANVLSTLPACDRFIYVSSTSVYGQTDGDWVNEDSPTEPREDAGKVVLEAEQQLRAKWPTAIVLRFGGIYGPDRLLRRKGQLERGEPLTGDPDRWLNLIHVDDGADAVLAAESRGPGGETYNIVDDAPITRRAYYTELARVLGTLAPNFDPQPEPGSPNRRVSNAKAKPAIDWTPHYPSCREGLPEAVRESTI